MDILSPGPWLCELQGSEDPMLFQEFETNYFENELSAEEMSIMLKAFENNSPPSHNNFSPLPTFTVAPHTYPTTSLNATMQDMRDLSGPTSGSPCSPPTPFVLSFAQENSNNVNNHQKEDATSSGDMDLWCMHNGSSSAVDTNQDPASNNDAQTRKRRGGSSRPESKSRDHIMAERKRREKISERFIALSALVPGLKKTDKTSVLGEAIKYMKQMQERLKTLEEDVAKRPVESVVITKKPRLITEDKDDDNDNDKENEKRLPEIEAKFCDGSVLLNIHFEKKKGGVGVVQVLSEIEKLHLSILNVHAVPFTHTTVHLTLVAQMEKGFDLTPQHVVKGLRSALDHL